MSDAENQNYKAVVLKRADDAVVSNAIFPELAQSALKPFADSAGIVKPRDSLVQKSGDASSNGFVELVEFYLSGRIELNRPLQG